MMETRLAPFGSVSYKWSGRFDFKEDRRVYLNLPPPVSSMHFRKYSLSVLVIFMVRRVDEIISIGNLMNKISDAVYYITIEEG